MKKPNESMKLFIELLMKVCKPEAQLKSTEMKLIKMEWESTKAHVTKM